MAERFFSSGNGPRDKMGGRVLKSLCNVKPGGDVLTGEEGFF
jgi:hypothetical protein